MKPYLAFMSAREYEFSPTAQAVVASFPDAMPDWMKICIMILVDHNLKVGNWERIRVLQLGYLNTTDNSMKDLKGLQNGTPVASPTFTPYNGYVTNGTTQYINRGINLFSNGGGIYTTNDAWACEHLLENLDTQISAVLMGAFGTVSTRRISLSQNPLTEPNIGILWRVNQSTAEVAVTEKYLFDDGIYIIDRSGVTVSGISHDNVLLQTSAISGGGSLPDVPVYSGCLNNNGVAGTFGKWRLGTFACGQRSGFNFSEFVSSLRTFRQNVLTYSVI